VRLFAPINITAVPTYADAIRGDDIADVDRHAVAGANHDGLDLVNRLDAARGADEVRLALVLHVPSAGRDVVLLQRLDHVRERQPVRDELHRVRLHMVLLDVTADRVHACDILHALELRPDNPVLHLAQVGGQLHVRS
jgi:hypothetical protein